MIVHVIDHPDFPDLANAIEFVDEADLPPEPLPQPYAGQAAPPRREVVSPFQRRGDHVALGCSTRNDYS